MVKNYFRVITKCLYQVALPLPLATTDGNTSCASSCFQLRGGKTILSTRSPLILYIHSENRYIDINAPNHSVDVDVCSTCDLRCCQLFYLFEALTVAKQN
jgi:hypothetical protein